MCAANYIFPLTCTIAGAAIGASATFVAAYFIGEINIRRQEFYKAAAQFRASFLTIYQFLIGNAIESYTKQSEFIFFKIESDIIEHGKAAIIFSAYFSNDNKRIDFWNSFYEYENPSKFREHNHPSSYARKAEYFTTDVNEEKEIRKLVLMKIQNLLAYSAKF